MQYPIPGLGEFIVAMVLRRLRGQHRARVQRRTATTAIARRTAIPSTPRSTRRASTSSARFLLPAWLSRADALNSCDDRRPLSPRTNPLLADWTGAFSLPPFGAIKPEQFRPAFDAALGRHRAEIDAIAADPAPPSFDNTIVALERAGRALDRVANVFFVLAGADTSPTRSRRWSAKSRRCSRATTTRSIWTARSMPASPSSTARRDSLGLSPSRRACSTATTPVSCARAARWRSRRRTGSRRSTSGWRASAPSSGRTCWPTRKPTRSFSRRAISPACRTSPAPPRARRPRSAATPANMPSRWRARPARPSCSFPRAATCARKSSRPGSSAAKMAARPTTAR